jgi:general secretion pathway protein C
MEALKKHFWAVNLLFLAGWAWMLAGSINGVIAHKLRELPSLTGASPAKARTGREDVLLASNQIIIDRNYFGSAMSKPVETVESGAELDEGSAQKLLDDEGLGVESSLRAALVGTIVAEPTSWSMAMITDLSASETGVYRIQDTLLEEATVVAILTDRVVVQRNGNREYLMLQDKAGTKKEGKAVAIAPRPGEGDSTLGEGIRKVDDTNYTIDRGEIDKTLSNLNSIAMQARIVPSFKNGESNGFKLFAIRPGSLYSKIGIQNGDIIHSINGFAMTSPDKALEVYQKLKSARSIDVELTRRGQTVKMTYNIQ